MKMLSSVAACFLAAQITCGGTTWNVPAEPVGALQSFDLGEDQVILAHGFLSKFWGGGGQKGQGGGPFGRPPTVTAKSFDVVDPPATGVATVGLVPVANAPTSCSITAGNSASLYSIAVTSGGCNIGITPAGTTGLNSTHVDKLTVTALNAAGTGTAIVAVNNYALPTMAATSFQVTPPVPLGPIGSAIPVANIPDTVAITACGSCTGFFQAVLSTNKTSISFNALAPATVIASGQSFTASLQLTNKAGSTTSTVRVTGGQILPIVQAQTYNVPFTSLASNFVVGAIGVQNNATSFAVTACTPSCTFGPTGNFNVSNAGQLITPVITGLLASTTYHPVITATNTAGTSLPVAQNVVIGAAPLPPFAIVSAGSYTANFPVPNNFDFGAITTDDAPSSFGLGVCPGCTGFFAMVGNHLHAVTGASFANGATYHPVVNATNARGTGIGVAQNVTILPPLGQPPVVTASIGLLSFPTFNGALALHVTATNTPTLYNITDCTPACVGFFSNPDGNGDMHVANAAAIQPSTTYNPVVTAQNAFGTSPGVTETVNIGAAPIQPPVVTAQSFTIPFASVVDGFDFGTIATTGGPPASYGEVSCTFNSASDCSTFFAVNTITGHMTIPLAISITQNTTYNLTVSASNGGGTGTSTQTVSIGAGNQSPPVVGSLNCIFSTPVTAGVALCPQVPVTNQPVTYSMTASCGGLFQIDANTGRISASPDGANNAAWNGSTNESTCQPTVKATNTGGNSSANQTLTGFADGSVNAPAATAQHPGLLNPTQQLTVVAITANTGAIAAQNGAIYQLQGGSVAPGGAAATIVVTSSGALFQVDGWNVKTPGSYTTIPANPVQVHCIQSCLLAPGRPATDGTIIAQWAPIAGTGGTTYVTRPPWKVAGVDYGVGPPDATVFIDPLTPGVLPAGCSISGTVVTCSTAGVTIQNFDFASRSLQLVCNATNMTIKNNKFKMALSMVANELIGGSNACTKVTITQNIIDGNGINNNRSGGQVWLQGNETGGATFTYNWIKNAPQDLYDHENGTFVSKFNIFENAGITVGNHGDWEQGAGTTNIHTDFNLGLNNVKATTQGWTSVDNIPGLGPANWIGANSISYNVGICNDGSPNAGDTCSAIIAPLGTVASNGQDAVLNGTLDINRNYFDSKNAFFPYYNSPSQPTDPNAVCRRLNVTCRNGVDLITGTTPSP